MSACVGWKGQCPIYGDMHGCRFDDAHTGEHQCECGVKSHTVHIKTVNPRPYVRRPPDYYLPKYMKRKRAQ